MQNRSMPYAKVLVESKSPGIANGLTYEASTVQPGAIVTVPMRKKSVAGIVLGPTKRTGDFDVKSIKEHLHEFPLLPEYALKTAEWMADYYCCSLRQAISPFLPAQRWSDLLPKTYTRVRLLDDEVPVTGVKQKLLVDYLRDENWVSLDKVRSDISVSLATIRSLEQKGLLVVEDHEIFGENGKKYVQYPSLTSAQKRAYEIINKSKKPTLLFGVTGSGKTEVYAQLIADAATDGKQSILLVPEILLTEHTITRFYDVLAPERIAVVHSRLTTAERKHIWRQCRANEIDLVIGSRSALFSPLEHLGVVVIDEEHEWTYKNEQAPRYHARETAEAICTFAGAKFVLGTATPSLESWQRTKTEQYALARIDERYAEQSLPDVSVVDLGEVFFQKDYPLSPTLQNALKETLHNNEQAVLFLNRRGHSSALLCMDCRKRVVSPETQLPFTVHIRHDGRPELVDHTTNTRCPLPAACPNCQSANLIQTGAGTQKLEEVLRSTFPNARLLRADSDTLQHPEQMRSLLQKMKNNEADILLGTQTVVKGLDLPNVTLAAVLVADIGMSLPHFRASERTFQLLTQLTGRSGRAKPGKVILQTFRPEAAEVQFAAMHKTEEFLERELRLREMLQYPPYTPLLRLLFKGPDAQKNATRTHALLSKDAEHTVHVAPTLFSGGKIWQLLVRGKNPRALIASLKDQSFVVDVDPVDCI